MDEWYVTQSTLDSIASDPLEHATGGMILRVSLGKASPRIVGFLTSRYGDRFPNNVVFGVREHLLNSGMTISYWAFRAREDAPPDQGSVYRISPRKSFVLYEDREITQGVLIATTEDLNPVCVLTNPVPQTTLDTGAIIRCDQENMCDVYATGVRWGYSPELGERVLRDPFSKQIDTVEASEEARIAIAKKLQSLMDAAVSVQLNRANVVVNPGWEVGSATVPDVIGTTTSDPFPDENCKAALLSIDPEISDIVYVTVGNSVVCLPRKDVDKFWSTGYSGFGSIAKHPIGTAVIRSKYPTYSPCDIGLLATRSANDAGWCKFFWNLTYLNVTALNVAAASVAIGRTPREKVVWLYLRTIFHEQAHRAEAQAGEGYVGGWSYDERGHRVAVGSEIDADAIGEAVAHALLIEDGDRTTAAIEKDLTDRIGIALSFPDIRWMRMVLLTHPGYIVKFEGVNPEQGLMYGIIARDFPSPLPLCDEVLAIDDHPEIVPYDHDTVVVLANVGSWLEDDYLRHRGTVFDGVDNSEFPDPMPNAVTAPIRGRERGPGSVWGFLTDRYYR